MKKFKPVCRAKGRAAKEKRGKGNLSAAVCALAIFAAALGAVFIAEGVTADAADTEQKVYFDSSGNPSQDENDYFIRIMGTTENLNLSGSAAYTDNVTGSSYTVVSNTNSCISSITPNGTGKYKIKYAREGTAEISYTVTSSASIPYLVGYTTYYYTDTITNSGTHKVRVVDYINNIYFPSTTATLTIGSSKSMAVETTDDYYSIAISEAIDGFYTYSSSDTSVATVDSNGKVTAKKAGAATITCTTTNGLTATCKVTVKSPSVTKITLNKSSVTLKIGKTAKLSYTISPTDAETTVTYSSSNKKVATVSSSGKITAKKAGTATITAKTSNGKTATCKVTVKKNPTSITLDKTKMTLLVGKKKTLTATIKPSSAVSDVTWSSSDTSIATVDSSGKVTAKKAGTVTITAKSYNGKKATCKVTVKKINATKIALSKTKLTINKGKSKTLTYTLTPSNATSTVKWSSSDTSIATVNSSGKVTAKKAGTVTITAKTSTGKKATCKVTVKAPITKVKLNKSSVTLNKGKTTTLKATISPSSTTSSKTLTWSSSDTSIATVSSSGKVTAKSAGTAKITVKTSNGKKATCKVTVKIPITSVKLNKSSVTLDPGDTKTLTATVKPSNTTGSKKITWSSSKTSVATVSSSGVVTAVKPGTATITAKSSNGKKASCKVTVSEIDATAITLKKTARKVDINTLSTVDFSSYYTLTPSDATSTVTWSSSNTSVLKLKDSSGIFSVVSTGKATITAKASSGVKATCVVTVRAEPTSITLNKSAITLELVGDTQQLTASLSPSNVTTGVSWRSLNETVATVDSNGLVTAVGSGTTTIYARTSNYHQAKCTVTVPTQISTAIEFDEEKLTIEVGETASMTYSRIPANSVASGITFVSSDESIALTYYTGNNKVKGISPGTVTVTATCSNGASDTITIVVVEASDG